MLDFLERGENKNLDSAIRGKPAFALDSGKNNGLEGYICGGNLTGDLLSFLRNGERWVEKGTGGGIGDIPDMSGLKKEMARARGGYYYNCRIDGDIVFGSLSRGSQGGENY